MAAASTLYPRRVRDRALAPATLSLLAGAVLIAAPQAPGATFTVRGLTFGERIARAAQANTAPGSVSDLAARGTRSRRIDLTFSAPRAGGAAPAYGLPVRRYLVKQSRRPITATTFASAQTLCGGACSFSVNRPGDRITLMVEDLIPNRLYYYALRPLDAAGRPGALSNVTSARTLKDRVRPGRPTRLSAKASIRSRIRLRFRAPGSDGRSGPPVRRYIVKQSDRRITSSRDFRRARSLCRGSCRFAPRRRGSRLSLSVRRVCPGKRYYYAIRAKDEGGNLSRLARFRPVTAKGRAGLVCL
jgi:hypothetical protein